MIFPQCFPQSRHKSVLCISSILFIFCYVFLQANFAVSGTNSGTSLDFQALLGENISKDARDDGLRLMIRTNNWDQFPNSHAEMVQCVDRDGGWNPDRSGFSVVDEVELNTNPHGVNSDYTAKYSGFFLVEEEGDWSFAVNSSGSSEIEIDGRVTASWYGDHTGGNFFDDHNASVQLTAGWHRIVFRYAVNDGTTYAEARFKSPSSNSWKKVSSTNLNLKSFPVADGLQLITKRNVRDTHAIDHDDLYVFVEIQPEDNIDYYGWGLVDKLDQLENIHGSDVGYTSRYESYFQVSEEQAGGWQFSLDSGDAAELIINDEMAVSWYGGHEPSGNNSHNATVTLQAGWHHLVLRNALNGATATNKVMFQTPQDNDWRLLSVSELVLKAFIHDLDDDGIHNDLEGILGTIVESSDTDTDGLNDFAEAMLNTNPRHPDSNNDGLGDAAELLTDNPDIDNDGIDNLWDEDNDGDEVIDALDMDPFSKTGYQENLHIEVDTSGKHTYLDFQIRPKNPDNLMRNGKKWDWPNDDHQGQMQDWDNSTNDLTLLPMLELTANLLPSKEQAEANGIMIANDPLLTSTDGHFTHNDGFGMGDVLGNGEQQMVVAGDKDRTITVLDRNGDTITGIEPFDSVFSSGDKLAVADILGDDKAEILVFNDYNSKIYVYSGEGHLICKKDIVYDKRFPIAVGDYRHNSDEKAEIVIGDIDNQRVWVFGFYSDGSVIPSHSEVGVFTTDDGLALGDVDGDGKKEILVAQNVDDKLFIYRSTSSAGFALVHNIDIDFDRSDGLISSDILPSDDPADPRFGDEIMVLKRSGGGIVYTEAARDAEGDIESLSYTTYDGHTTTDMFGNNQQEIVVASDTSGAVQVYSPSTRKAYVPLSPVLDNGKPVAFQGRMVYNATGGPVTLTAEVRLVWMVVGKTDTKNEPDAGNTTILAKYSEDFQLTGFTATEQRGASAALFHNNDSEAVSREQVARAYTLLDHAFLHGNDGLSDAIGKINEVDSNIDVTVTEGNSFDHDFESVVWMEEQMKSIVTDALPHGIFPVTVAVQSQFASLTLKDVLEESLPTGGFHADLTGLDGQTTKSIKMNWYDTSLNVVSPLTIDQLETESDSWELSEDEIANDLTLFLMASLGAIEIGSPVYQATRYDLGTYLKKAGGGLVSLFFAGESSRNLYWAARATRATNANILSRGYNVSKAKFAKMYKLSSSSNLMAKAARFSNTTRILAKFGGPVAGVAMASYTFYKIGSDSGWSNSGTATAGLYSGMQVGYFMALGMISAIPVAGPVIAVLVVTSDLIVLAITGSTWSDQAMDWVVDKMTEDRSPKPYLKITNTQVTITDYENNGITVGDRIEFRCRATETIKRYSKENLAKYRHDMRSSYLQPRAKFYDSKRYDKGSSRFLVDYSLTETRKQKIWDFGGWAEPKEADTGFYASVRMETEMQLYYRHCTAGACDREKFKDTFKSEYTDLYFDVLPATLADFVVWSAITPLDKDNDGINDALEDTPGGTLFSVSGPSNLEHNGKVESGDSEPDGNDDFVYFSDETAVPPSRFRWEFEPDGNGYFQITSQHHETEGWPALLSAREGESTAWFDNDSGDDSLWKIIPLRNDEVALVNKGRSEAAGEQVILSLPHNYGGGDMSPMEVKLIDDDAAIFLMRLHLEGGSTKKSSHDTDGDGLFDGFELNAPVYGMHLDAFKADTDGDGLSDSQELIIGSDPTRPDSDEDGLSDGDEVNGWLVTLSYNGQNIREKVFSDPVSADSDGDGLNDQEEFSAAFALNPASRDTDGDGIPDNLDPDPTNPPSGTINSDGDDLFDDTENSGWEIIVTTSGGTEVRQVTSDPTLTDTDSDGIPDHREYRISDPRSSDTDGDGLSDTDETVHGSDILHFDSDGDGLADGDEIAQNTNPNDGDTDNDNLSDGEEINTYGTSPILNDTDGDGLNDSEELQRETNPLLADTDGDTLSDGAEIQAHNTNPLVPDSDGDGLRDDLEIVTYHTNPNKEDTDGDTISDSVEVGLSCAGGSVNPLLPDTDGDSLGDYEEIYVYGTSPCKADTDNDGLTDVYELTLGSDPNNNDTDADTILDGDEINKYGSNPLLVDSDGDHLPDEHEIKLFGTNPGSSDTDGDGIPDDMDPNTLRISQINIPQVLVLYDDVIARQDEIVDNLRDLFGEDNILTGTPTDFPDMADYPYILMLGLPDDEAPDGTVGDMMDQLLDEETKVAMLAEKEALEQGLTDEELDDAVLLSMLSRFAVSAVPVYNGLPPGGSGALPPPPAGPQVNLGLANSLIVMLTAPLSNDTSRIINTLVSLRTSFWENFAFMEWGGLQNNFILDGIIQTDTEIDAILVTDAIAGMAALSTYPDSLTEHQLREENGLAAGQETIGKYILAEFAASTIDPPAIIPLQNATLRIYYTSLDLDRSLLRDGDITDIGDINEDTLSLYRWNSTGNTYELMSDGLPWVSDITLNTTNITVGDTDYEGYMDVTVSDDLGLFALGGIPNPDTTIAGAPAVVATTPMADADNVSVDAPIVVTFSEPVINENPDLIEMDGAVILSTSLAGNTLTIEHGDFVSGSSYLVTIPDSTVIDLAGNYNEEYSWTFTAVEPNNIPFANDDAFSCSENGSLSVNVFDDNGHGVDWDSEDDPLTITAVNNNDNNLDNPISGTGGGLFTLGADGDLIFETNSEFERIPDGMSLESSIIYTLGDGVGSDMATVTVTVSGVNNHPVLSSDERLLNPVFADAGNDNGTGADEDNDISDNYDNPGDFVADIIASTGTAVDTDNDALGMAVVGIDNRSGIWEYNLDNINWQSMNSLLSEYNSLLLPPGARIRFVPDPHINCTKASALSFKLWDQTSGTGGIEYWDSTTSNAFSINEALAVLQVNSVPWLPTEGDYDGDGIQNCEDSDPLQRGVLDTDNDGIDDEWEELYFDNLNQADGRSDFDGDGYSDLYEYLNWQNGTLDPDGYGFDPTLINAPGGEHYGEGLQSRSFWPMMMPAILSGAIN